MTNVLAFIAAQVSSSPDPLSFFTSLGVGGMVAVVMYLWQRDTAKQRDRAVELLEERTETLNHILTAIESSTQAHKDGTAAARAMTDLLGDMPTREEWFRLRQALEDSERGRARRNG